MNAVIIGLQKLERGRCASLSSYSKVILPVHDRERVHNTWGKLWLIDMHNAPIPKQVFRYAYV